MKMQEILRKEMEKEAPFTKEEFICAVVKGIRSNGVFSFSINARAEKSYSLWGGAEIPSKWLDLVRIWVLEEGFNISRITNYYGIPEYDVTL